MNALLSIRNRLIIGLTFCIVFAGFGVLITPSAYACSCVVPPPPAEAMDEAAHVFSGEVLEIVEVGTGASLDVRIRVDRSWKGVSEHELTVRTPGGSAACGFHFEVGKEYLVYTYEMEDQIQVSLCSRTALLSDAADDLAVLGSGTQIGSLDGDDAPASEQPAEDDSDDGLNLRVIGGSSLLALGIALGLILIRRWQ